MSHFTLPYIHNILQNYDFNFKFEIKKETVEPTINKSLFKYLSVIKEQIDDNPDKWDTIKKYTNPYEFIHTTIPNLKFSISKYIPISRSYFKLIEILRTFYILEDLTDETCRWPLGPKLEPASFFCGRKPVESKNSGKKFGNIYSLWC